MLQRMNHKIIENWISYICGVFGFGISWTNTAWADAFPKIAVAAVSAGVAGGMGYIGKLVAVWGLRKLKLFFSRLKKYIMDPNNPFLLWLQEMVLRFSAKSPKFFVILQWLAGATAAVAGLPSLINGFIQMFQLQLPPAFSVLENKTVAVAAAVSWIIAKLPVKSPAITVTTDGALIKKTDANTIPFTAGSEKKAALKEGLAGSATLKEVINSTNK